MIRNIAVFSLIFFVLVSCGSHKEVISSGNLDNDVGCLSRYSRNLPQYKREEPPRPYFRVELGLVIKDSDTLDISELICVDSVKFTQVLNEFEASEICAEMGIQGDTYFSATTNKYGGFEEVKVVRSVDSCFKHLEEKIKQKVLTMRIIPENAGTYEITFRYYYRLN